LGRDRKGGREGKENEKDGKGRSDPPSKNPGYGLGY